MDTLTQQLHEAQREIASLREPLANLSFDPEDQESVRKAIRKMEAAIDSKVFRYGGNELVSSFAERAKEQFRGLILSKSQPKENDRNG